MLTIPIKIVVKREVAVILSLCYKCRTKYKVMLSTVDRDQWLPLIRDLFNRCESCGMVIPHEWAIYGASLSLGGASIMLHRNLRLANPCPNCRGNGPKAIDDWLWSFLKPQDETLPKFQVMPSATKLFCSNCGNSIVPGAQFCTNCGSKV